MTTASDNTSRLLALAKERFGSVSNLEKELFEAVANGTFAELDADRSQDSQLPDTQTSSTKPLLKADRITWLCTDPQAKDFVSHLGICIGGIRTTDKLELSFAKIPFPLCFRNCAFPEGIDLHNADIFDLSLGRTSTGRIRADGLTVEKSLYLDDGFKAEGEVHLLGARIGGALVCINACFLNPGGFALSADNMRVQDTVFLSGRFEARGGVRFVGARIGGNLECDGSRFVTETPEATCFDAERALVEGHVFLRNGFTAQGEVRLLGARIGRSLDCENAHFKNPQETALFADGLKASDVHLRNGFHAEGEIRLRGASINGSLDCDKGLFTNPDGYSLAADGINVEGNVLVGDGFRAEGELSLRSARIGGQLDFSGGRVVNNRRKAISADDMTVMGSVFLNHGFVAEGEVCLHGTTINGALECQEGRFINPRKNAIAAHGVKIRSGVYLSDNFSVEGNVCLANATIHGELVCTDIHSRDKFMLDLRSARAGALRDDETGWPPSGKLLLHGFVYDQIGDDSSTVVEQRIDWIRLQPSYPFRTQPYEQLAAVLRRNGQSEDAQKVLMAKAKDCASFTQLTWPQKAWYSVVGRVIGYGYRPWRAFWIGLMVILVGSALFGYGHSRDIMTATQERAYASGTGTGSTRNIAQDYPKFDPVLYSVDMFVPVVTFHQASYWLPDANRGNVVVRIGSFVVLTGGLLRYYLVLHILMGWVLTTLLIVGLTGLIRG